MAQQTPNEKLSYTCYIEPSNNDTIVGSLWSISPTGPTVSSSFDSGSSSTVFVSGVTLGVTYNLTVLITGTSTSVYAGLIEIDGTILGRFSPWHFDHCYNDELNRAGVLRCVVAVLMV